MDQTTHVRDVSEATFATDVVQASHSRPVVVDFWAPWCGPCHQLSPLLERAAAQHAGQVAVVKLNVDEAPGVAREYRVQGIPAVKAFRGGAVVAEFTGAQPQPVVERFFAVLVPSAADRLVERAEQASGEERERLLREAVAADPGHARARRLLAELELASRAVDDDELRGLRHAADAGDATARVALGKALAAAGDHAGGLELLVVAAREPDTREAARQAALEVFEALGDEHDAVRTYRPKLASALF
jgi:putative thioredoxin